MIVGGRQARIARMEEHVNSIPCNHNNKTYTLENPCAYFPPKTIAPPDLSPNPYGPPYNR
jgi:hypothetical protein